MAKQLSLWQRVCAIKAKDKMHEAQALYEGIQSAEALAKGPDPNRASHWQQQAAWRVMELKRFLEVWG